MMRETITTDRLVLRRYAASDVPRLIDLADDIRVAQNLPRMPHPYTQKEADDLLERQAEMWAGARDRPWAIELPGEGLIGMMGLHRGTRMNLEDKDLWQLSYWLGFPYWGKGYATEAGRAVLAELERAEGCQDVTAGYALKNPNSGHVLEKLGFHQVDGIRELTVLSTGELSPIQLMLRPAPTHKPQTRGL